MDPAIYFYLARATGLDNDEIESLLNRESGLKGICGANDMREVHRLAEAGNVLGRLALDMYCYRIKKYIGAYYAVLGGLDAVPGYIDFEYTFLFDKDPDHRGFVVVESDWKTGTFNNESVISLIFEPELTNGRLDLSSSTIAHGFWQMTRLGVHHIWIGIDHILFLLALLLPAVVQRNGRGWMASRSFKASLVYVLKIVTLFTVAHTITLSAATLGSITVPGRLVESVIALSIAVAAADLLWPIFRERIWWVVFVFGLFHGMGFASVLSSIGVPAGYMAYSLLAFNIGVELGQLAIVCIAFPLLYALRQGWFYQRLFLPASASLMILVSLYWFIERGFLIDLPAGEYANWILTRVGARGV